MSFTFSVFYCEPPIPVHHVLTMEDVEILLALINQVDDHRTYPLESPRNAHPFDPNERTRRIFDSLAEILVHNVAGEVVAVGIQRNEERVTITFSTNQSQEPHYIHDHLDTIWGLLKQASEVYRRHQSPAPTPKSSPQSPRSPRSPRVTTTERLPADEQDKIYNLLLAIYGYSSKKYLSRVQKRRDVTKPTRFEIFQRIVNSIGPLNGELGELLNEVSTTVDLIVQDLSSAHVLTSATQDFKDLCGCFEHLAFIVEKLEGYPQELKRIADSNGMLFNYTQCILARAMFNTFQIDFPLHRYVKKLSSLPNAIQNLLAFASSPRLRSLFLENKTMQIRYVSGGQHLKYPKPTKWGEVARVALETHNENPRSIDHGASHRNKNSVYAPIHCEVAVALHFLSQNLGGPPPLPFIGVFKLSCFGCWSLFKALQRVGANIATRGTHGKAYFPWKYPEELRATQYAGDALRVKADVYSIFAERYTTCILARRMEIGSDGSRCETENNRDPDAPSYALAAKNRKREKYRGSAKDDTGKRRRSDLAEEAQSKRQRRS